MTPTEPTTPQALLNRAADLLDERGWAQRTYLDRDGCLCALGAVRTAAAEAAGITDREGMLDVLFDPSVTVLGQPVRLAQKAAEDLLDSAVPTRDVAIWNDSKQRTENEVVELLRRLGEPVGGVR